MKTMNRLLIILTLLVASTGSLSAQTFLRGDASNDGSVNIGDAVAVLNYLFDPAVASLPCLASGDIDASGGINIADAVNLLGFLFSGGISPALPFPECGESATGAAEPCATSLCPISGPLVLAWPMPGQVSDEWVINNYVDLNTGPGILDYNGGAKTYNGHRGIDIDVPTFRAMDNGYPILACAPGVVVAMDDSHFDRNMTCSGDWNFVTLEHSNGWQTIYGHLKQDSIVVDIGDSVATGDILGVVGSSGCSTAPHLHLQVEDENGNHVEPFELGMILNPPAYNAPFGLMDTVINGHTINSVEQILDPLPNITHIARGQVLGVGFSVGGGTTGDTIEVQLRDDVNALAHSSNIPMPANSRHTFHTYNRSIPTDASGTWHLSVRLNGSLVLSYPIEIGGQLDTPSRKMLYGLTISEYQTQFNELTSLGYRLRWIDGYEFDNTARYNAIFEQTGGPAWYGYHNQTSAQLISTFNLRTGEGYRLTHVDMYVSGGSVRYASIYELSPGSAWFAYIGASAADHNVSFNDLWSQGFRPVAISLVEVGGQTLVSALYNQDPTGGLVALAGMDSAGYQTEFNTQVNAGRKLVYLDTWLDGGGTPRFSGIWQSIGASGWVATHSSSATQLYSSHQEWKAVGLEPRVITGYKDGANERFGALWTN